MPAANVETEAKDRLGLETEANGRVIEAAIALRYPHEIGEAHNLSSALSEARLSYCVFTENGGASRFPDSGWLDGSVEDLADMVRLVSVPQHAVDRATTTLQEGIDGAAKLLDELDQTRPGITAAIAALLGMANVPPNPPYGLRHHRQRPRIPRSDRRNARAHQIPRACLRRQRRQPAGRSAGSLDRHTENKLLAHLRHRQGYLATFGLGRRGQDPAATCETPPSRSTQPA